VDDGPAPPAACSKQTGQLVRLILAKVVAAMAEVAGADLRRSAARASFLMHGAKKLPEPRRHGRHRGPLIGDATAGTGNLLDPGSGPSDWRCTCRKCRKCRKSRPSASLGARTSVPSEAEGSRSAHAHDADSGGVVSALRRSALQRSRAAEAARLTSPPADEICGPHEAVRSFPVATPPLSRAAHGRARVTGAPYREAAGEEQAAASIPSSFFSPAGPFPEALICE
jgi:hypothetical protein